jgi:hypothetical protein
LKHSHFTLGKQVTFLGHFPFLNFLSHALEEQAVLDIAGRDGRAGIASEEQTIAVVDAQAAGCLGIRRMALVAVAHQYGAHLGFEELNLRRIRSVRSGERGHGKCRENRDGGTTEMI